MEKSCLDDHILSIQCKHGDLADLLTTHLSIGSKKVVCLSRSNIATGYVLNVLRSYVPFTSTVTFAAKFDFVRVVDGTSTVSLTLQSNVFADYVGTGTAEDIAAYFKGLIDAGGLTIAYETIIIGGTLYVYSYDAVATATDTALVAVNNTEVTATSTNLINNLEEILDLSNTITALELCQLISFATNTSEEGVKVTGSTNGCNC